MNTATKSMRVLASATLMLMTCTSIARDDENRHAQAYANHVLVSNGAIPADFTDPNLVNGWGLSINPAGIAWVNDADSGVATLYDGTGQALPLVVTVPGPAGAMGHPTGLVFSAGTDFVVSSGTSSGPARFIFATEDGTIAGWAPDVNATDAITIVDNSGADAIYTGLALSGDGTTHLLYAANFHAASIDVFDSTFHAIQVQGGFVDPRLPRNFAPFGVQAINGDIYVTYAKQDEAAEEEIQGPGLGFVNVFDPQGNLIRRIASRGLLNAPWGLALAPASFGRFGGALLVGNLGDGTINAFGPRSGRLLGTLRDSNHRPLRLDGLWGIAFGAGVGAQPTNALFYAAGPNDEEDGAFGVVTVVDTE